MRKRNNIDAVIFDWSGTISNDILPVYEANKRIIESYGKKAFSFQEWLLNVAVTLPHLLHENFGIKENIETIFSLYETFYKEVNKEGITPFIYPDALPALSFLKEKQITLAVLSSHIQSCLETEAERYEIKSIFKILKGDSINKSEGLITIAEGLSISPEKSIYVGDMAHDIIAARAAGYSSAALSRGYHPKEKLEAQKPSLGVFNSLTEFVNHLR